MDFVTLTFGLFLLIGVIVYYFIPKNKQWIWLLILGMFFYAQAGKKACVFLAASILTSYLYGIFHEKGKKIGLFTAICFNLALLAFVKFKPSFVVVVGISFYTLQIIAYMVDVYKKDIKPERNLFRYALFVTFFPQILQGPIPRWKQLSGQLFEGHRFDYETFCFGLWLMIWGYFQKLVIADRCAIVVNTIFGNPGAYEGVYAILGGVLYSIQLYTDFNGCVCIATGVAQLFGITLTPNFKQPYFATGISDFWHRWHISLSSWLRDYIYIPLGGNRKGTLRKYINLLLTFLISGIWHGGGLHFIVWGLMHGCYQVLGSVFMPVRNKLVKVFSINRDSFSHQLYKRIVTFTLVMLAWVMFRADSVMSGLRMMRSMLVLNPWVLVNGDLYTLGIGQMEFTLLMMSIVVLFVVSFLQDQFHKNGVSLRDVLAEQSLIFRWGIILLGIFTILLFGIYGPGYDASEFIYGQF